GKLADAAIAIQERRLMHADVLLDGVEHDVFATRELLRSAAAEVLGQARGEVARARAGGIGVETANRMWKDAEASYSEARYGDTIYAGKACMSEVEELARSTADTKRKTDAEEDQAMAERADLIRGRMEAVRAEIGNLVAQNVDLAKAVETLKAAEQAIGRGSLDEAERLVANAEGMVQGVKVTLNGQANAELRRARKAIELAAADRLEAPEFAALLERAQAAITGGRPAEVLRAVGGLERDCQGAHGRARRGREKPDRPRGPQDSGRAGQEGPDGRRDRAPQHRRGELCARGIRGRGRTRAGCGAERLGSAEDRLGAGGGSPPEVPGGRAGDRLGPPEDDGGPRPSRHLDPGGGASARAGGSRGRRRPLRGRPAGTRGHEGNGGSVDGGPGSGRERPRGVRGARGGRRAIRRRGPGSRGHGPCQRAGGDQ